jgi:AAA+ ATPase superfamily predicted ATPase
MSEGKVKVKCDLYWAQLKKQNEMSGKFQVDLCNLSDAACKALEDLGIEIKSNKDKPEQGKYITCKSSNPIKAFEESGEEIDEIVGNGSKAKALISAYEWKYKNKSGVSPSLAKLVITDLVVYENANGGMDDEEVL